MTRPPRARPGRPPRRPRLFRPRLEALEARWLPSASAPGALRDLPGFEQHLVARGDDNSSGLVPIGFTLNFFGQEHDALFVNTNGSVSFADVARSHVPVALESFGYPAIAAYWADVDTRPADGGTVSYGQGVLDGHRAFAVTWEDVGYYAQHTDKTNTFQLVLIDRSDLGPGAFDLELNYARVQWESGDVTGSGGLGGSAPARVGFSAGSGLPGASYEVPGSGVAGALVDGGPWSLVAANPSGTAGRLTFFARDGRLTDRLNDAPAPSVELTGAPSISPAGTEWVAVGRITDPDGGPWTVGVDFGDGTPPRQATAAPDGSFELRYVFTAQSTYQVSVTVVDRDGGVGRAGTRVFVLPAGSEGRVQASTVEVARPGETVTPSVSDEGGTQFAARYARAAGATGEVSVFLALYDGPPLPTTRTGLFVDLQVGGSPAPGDEIGFTIVSGLLRGAFEFGYFDHGTGEWVSLLDRPDLCDVTVDAATGTLTVRFRVTDIFQGTVFTVGLPAGNGVQTTATVQGPTASAAPRSSAGASSGNSAGLGQSVTFTSNTQLAVALTSSQTSQVAVSASAQGSQPGGAGAGISGGPITNTTSATGTTPMAGEDREGAGRARPPKAPIDDAALWQLLFGDEMLLRLWMQGLDLTPLLTPADGPGPMGALLPGEGDGPGLFEEPDVRLALRAEALLCLSEEAALPASAAEAGDSWLASGAVAVAGAVAGRGVRRRRRRRVTLPDHPTRA